MLLYEIAPRGDDNMISFPIEPKATYVKITTALTKNTLSKPHQPSHTLMAGLFINCY